MPELRICLEDEDGEKEMGPSGRVCDDIAENECQNYTKG